jgi:hypothetical protein
MKRTVVPLLRVVGIVGLVLFSWFYVAKDERQVRMHVGRRSPWFTHERDDREFRTEVNLLTPRGANAMAAVVAFTAEWRRRAK